MTESASSAMSPDKANPRTITVREAGTNLRSQLRPAKYWKMDRDSRALELSYVYSSKLRGQGKQTTWT